MNDDSDSDIESQMDFYSDAARKNTNFSNRLADRTKQIGTHPMFEFISKRNESFKYNAFTFSISLVKLIVTIFVIFAYPVDCQAPVDFWLGFVCIHDFFTIVARSLLISSIISRRKKEEIEDNSSTSSIILGHKGSFRDLQLQMLDSTSRKRKHLLNDHSKRKEAGNGILSFSLLLLLGLFIWGQFIYYNSFQSCTNIPEFKEVVFLINIFFGYFYIGMPLMFLLFGCICLGWLYLGSRYLGRFFGKSEKAKVRPSRYVQTEKYSPEFIGGNDCGICKFDYIEGDDISRLSCDQAHHFHQKCLAKWMLNNRVCPICEKKIRKRHNKEKVGMSSTLN